MDLNNIVGFKAVDKNGNERQVTIDEMTELVSARIVSAASEISTFAAAAAAGTDEFEDQLPQSDTFSWLRTLDGSKNPTLTSSSAAAKVLGGLLGVNETWFRNRGNIRGEINLDDFKDAGAYSLFNIEGNNVPTSWAQLLVFSSGYYITQIIVDVSSRKLFIRRYDIENDRWQEWGNIIMT